MKEVNSSETLQIIRRLDVMKFQKVFICMNYVNTKSDAVNFLG
jgi:hypothetical protein